MNKIIVKDKCNGNMCIFIVYSSYKHYVVYIHCLFELETLRCAYSSFIQVKNIMLCMFIVYSSWKDYVVYIVVYSS